MEKIVEHGLLYDFYGELLTAHQRQIYEDAVYHDMSLAEIADIQGISRQGVHDLVRRCDKILEQYEERLGLVKKFALIKEKAQRIGSLAGELSEQRQDRIWNKQTRNQKSNMRNIAEPDGKDAGKPEIAEPDRDKEKLLLIRTLSEEIVEEL